MVRVGVGAVLDASVSGVFAFGVVRPGVPFVGSVMGRGVSGEGEGGEESDRRDGRALEEDWQGGALR